MFLMAKHNDLIAAEVRAAASRRGKTQADLAEILCLGRGAVSRRLNGHQEFSIDELYRLADALEVDASVFIRAGKGAA